MQEKTRVENKRLKMQPSKLTVEKGHGLTAVIVVLSQVRSEFQRTCVNNQDHEENLSKRW